MWEAVLVLLNKASAWLQQVPSSLVVCFVSAKESLVNFTREKNWSSRVYLGAGSDVAIHWELFKGTVQPGGRIEYSTV